MKNEINQPPTPEAEPNQTSRLREGSAPESTPATTTGNRSIQQDEEPGRRSTGFSRLALRSLPPEEQHDGEADLDVPSEDDDDGDGDPAASPVAGAGGNAPRDPRKALVAAAMAAAITHTIEEGLRGRATLALVVSVPAADWIAPVTEFFQQRPFGREWLRFARDGSERLRHKTSVGNDEVASALAGGRSVVGIAVNPEAVLPATLVAAADQRIKVRLDGPAVVRTIRALYDEIPPQIDDAHLVRLELEDVVAAMRPDAGAREVAARIAAAAEGRGGVGSIDDVPDLTTAVEYGAAREWGLALARDMRDYRAGVLGWSAVDRGAVFFSGPGMGKSVLARSIARACEATLVAGSIGELFATSSGHLDGVIKSMRELFARAASAAPSILFLDEIDGLPSRESLDSRNRDWWMPVIEDFMLQLDDATSGRREGVVVIGATNRIGAVDPAILRPGRLERAIEVTAPGPEGILNILRFHVRGSLSDEELRTAIGPLDGCTAAEIMETVRSARRKARQAGRDVSIGDLRDAALPELGLPPEVLYRIAVHEAGHVLTAYCCGLRVVSVRMGGRDGAGGVTRIEKSADMVTRHWIEQQVVGLLSGRAAEIVLLGAASIGAGGSERSDLSVATRLLAAMNRSYGLGDDELIYLADADGAHRELGRDPVARRRINDALRRLQARAVDIVGHHREQVADVAEALLRRRFLSAEDIEVIVGRDRSSPKCVTPAGSGSRP
jgi:SpoVK/Ycf46/Vps4 family AAA+-type ATPase